MFKLLYKQSAGSVGWFPKQTWGDERGKKTVTTHKPLQRGEIEEDLNQSHVFDFSLNWSEVLIWSWTTSVQRELTLANNYLSPMFSRMSVRRVSPTAAVSNCWPDSYSALSSDRASHVRHKQDSLCGHSISTHSQDGSHKSHLSSELKQKLKDTDCIHPCDATWRCQQFVNWVGQSRLSKGEQVVWRVRSRRIKSTAGWIGSCCLRLFL